MKKKWLAVLTAAALLLASGPALAEKHERVYGILNADGSAQTIIDSVWLDNPDGDATLTDATALSDIQNTMDSRTHTLDGETLTWDAQGEDVYYQGNSTQALPVTPQLSCTLDGETADATQALTGAMQLTVTYASASTRPHLALSALLLSSDTCRSITVENGFSFSDGSRVLVIGYGVTGCDKLEDLPTSFTVSADVAAFTPGEVMTVVTSEPIGDAVESISERYGEVSSFLRELTGDLTALQNGDSFTGSGDLRDAMDNLAELLSGASQLADGADTLATGAESLAGGASDVSDGAAQAQAGAATLQAGLDTIAENSDTLNTAASQVFDTLLAAATTQVQASLPQVDTLTQANYAQVLGAAIDSLSEDGIRAQVQAAAEEQVRQAVAQNEDTIREKVTESVQSAVLEAVLKAANLSMTAEEYQQAVKAGQVTKAQQTQLEAAVEAQMATDDVQTQIDAAVAQQEEQLVQAQMAGDEVTAAIEAQVQAALPQAQAGEEQLTALKAQLDAYAQFQQGLAAYTGGVTQADAGAASLAQGLTTLAQGAQTLADGAQSLSTGAGDLADGADALSDGLTQAKAQALDTLLPKLQDEVLPWLTKYDAVAARTAGTEQYDLVAEGMNHSLVFILRNTWAQE